MPANDPPIRTRARAEQLAESEARFRASFDRAPVGLAHVSLGGEWLAVNRRLCALLGYEREELLGLRVQNLTHRDDLASDLDQALRLIAGDVESYAMVKRYVRKDGTLLWARLNCTLVRDGDGRPFHFIAAVEELSDVDRAEAERRAQATAVEAERLAFALDGANDGIWDWSVGTGAVYFSPGWCRMLGYEPADVRPHLETWEALVHPDDRAAVARARADHLEGRVPQFDAEYRLRRQDGSWAWVLTRGKVVARDADGRARRAVGTLTDVTARKVAEVALAESDARLLAAHAQLDATYRNAPVGLCTLDRDLRFVQINERLAAMDGLPAAAHVGRTGEEIVPEYASRMTPLLERVRDTGEPLVDYELRAAAAWDPTVARDWLLNYRPIRDEAGAVVGVAGAVTEVTELKRAEDALRASEARLRRVTESGIIGVVYCRYDGAVFEANDAFLEMLGHERAALASGQLDWRTFTPPEWAEADARAAAELRARGTATPFAKEYLRADGTRVPVWVSIAVLPDAPDALVALVQDVSVQHAAERELARALADERAARAEAEAARADAEERRRESVALRDVTRDLLSTTELAATLQRVVYHARVLLGAGFAAVATIEDDGTTRWLAADGNRSTSWRDAVFAPGKGTAGRAVVTGAPVVIDDFPNDPRFPPEEFPLHVAEGARSALGLPLIGVDGRPFGALVVGWREPTAIGAREIATGTALTRPASAAIVNATLLARLRDAQSAAEAANRAKSDFLAAMSHELRTPLNAIQGYAQLIEIGARGPVTEAQRVDLARIQGSQRHLLRLINDVLDFAKLESGRATYDVAPVTLGDVASDVLPMIAPQAAAKRVTVTVESLPSVRVLADRDKLGQVLLNLLANAVKFTPDGGQVVVDAAEGRAGDPPSSGTIYLRVSDNGPGIAPAQQHRIFDAFVQVGTGARREGTGLWLAISRDLVRGMGAELRVRSTPGAGATFTVSLRRADIGRSDG